MEAVIGSASAGKVTVGVRFCQSHTHHHEEVRSIVGYADVSDPLRTLRPFNVQAKNIVGCSHPLDGKSEESCILCAKSLNSISPFLALCKTLDAERNAVADFVMDNRNILTEAITWLSARRDWAITCETSWYFSQTYQVLAAAMNAINALAPHELDGRATAAWRESALDMSEMTRPAYCSWLYLPRGRKENVRVFYVATRVPSDNDILDYLMVVLQPPKALIDKLTDALSKALDSPRSFAESRQRRRDSLYQRPRINNAERVVEGSVDGDPRTARAERLDTIHMLRKMAEERVPRMMLVSTSLKVTTLQPRPDYIITPHHHYINVFNISLPATAPDVWPNDISDPYCAAFNSGENAKW